MINLIGKTITHTSLGNGVITNFYPNKQRFTVKFENGSEMLYQYPIDFKYGILKLNDNEANAELEIELSIINKEILKISKAGKDYLGIIDPKGGTVAPYKNPLEVDKLEHGIAYGTKAEDIYNDLCHNPAFNWNKSKAYMFGPKMRLAATNGTKANETVWFLPYSTYNNDKNNKIGTNIIYSNYDIEQVHDTPLFNDKLSSGYIGETQIVFIKNLAGQYEFWGEMKITEINNEKKPYSTYSKFVSGVYYK